MTTFNRHGLTFTFAPGDRVARGWTVAGGPVVALLRIAAKSYDAA